MAAFAYQIVARTRAGTEGFHEYGSDDALGPGDIVFLDGRFWLVERSESGVDGAPTRLVAEPARYRIRLQHSDGREEIGAFRRFRPDAPPAYTDRQRVTAHNDRIERFNRRRVLAV